MQVPAPQVPARQQPPAQSTGATQSRDDIFRDLDARLAELSQVADDVYARWATGLAR
jgi:hypothetical protein